MRIYNIWPLSSLKRRSIALPLTLLSRRDHVLLIAVISVTLFLAILDLLGVLLIGVIGSLSITGISTGQMGDRVSKVIQFLTLDKFELESQVITIGLIAATLLIAKTLLSLVLVRKTLFFYGPACCCDVIRSSKEVFYNSGLKYQSTISSKLYLCID